MNRIHRIAAAIVLATTSGMAVAQEPVANDAATLQRLVQQEYRALWTKKDGRFTVAAADELYANNEHLTAFDTDLAAIRLTPDQSTRLQGYAAYRDIWPRIFEQVGGFEQSIGHVQIRINGNWAVTLFDGKGTFTTLDGKQVPTYKNFTLLWERQRDGWRIIHEHISDGR